MRHLLVGLLNFSDICTKNKRDNLSFRYAVGRLMQTHCGLSETEKMGHPEHNPLSIKKQKL